MVVDDPASLEETNDQVNDNASVDSVGLEDNYNYAVSSDGLMMRVVFTREIVRRTIVKVIRKMRSLMIRITL